jgi:hypothetical protein
MTETDTKTRLAALTCNSFAIALRGLKHPHNIFPISSNTETEQCPTTR